MKETTIASVARIPIHRPYLQGRPIGLKTFKGILRSLLIGVTVVVIALGCVACSSSNGMSDANASDRQEYLGVWKATTASTEGADLNINEAPRVNMEFDLKDDGTCTMDLSGNADSGVWEPTDNGFIVEQRYLFNVSGDTAEMEWEGVTISFDHL